MITKERIDNIVWMLDKTDYEPDTQTIRELLDQAKLAIDLLEICRTFPGFPKGKPAEKWKWVKQKDAVLNLVEKTTTPVGDGDSGSKAHP